MPPKPLAPSAIKSSMLGMPHNAKNPPMVVITMAMCESVRKAMLLANDRTKTPKNAVPAYARIRLVSINAYTGAHTSYCHVRHATHRSRTS